MTIFKRKKKEKEKSSINRVFEPMAIPIPNYDPRFDYLTKFFFIRIEEDMRRFGQRYMMGVNHPAIQSYRAMVLGDFHNAMVLKAADDYMRVQQSEHYIASLVDAFFSGMATWIKIAKDELKFKDILQIRDIEQRMVALKRYGVEKLLYDTKAETIHKSKRGNELYLIPQKAGLFSQDAYYLKYSDPSTGRIYISGVPPQMGTTKDADACMAWKHGLSTEAYQLLTNEA